MSVWGSGRCPVTVLRVSAERLAAAKRAEAQQLDTLAECEPEIRACINSLPLRYCEVVGHDPARDCEVRLEIDTSSGGYTIVRFWQCRYRCHSISLYDLLNTVHTGLSMPPFKGDAVHVTRLLTAIMRDVPPRKRTRTLILASQRRRRQHHGFPRLPPELWSMIFHEFVLGE